MLNILEQIMAQKRKELDRNQQLLPLDQIVSMITESDARVRFSDQVAARKELHVISEFKRKSPSKPLLNVTADVKMIASGYEQAGASALSILTDGPYFGGSAADLKAAREVTTLPVLRKDFIIDPYQVYESKMMGSDLILLIAEALDAQTIAQLTHLAHQLGLEVILELHSKKSPLKTSE
ncbi:MAG: indole-3-glycerol-phosphate synthase [Saprospiraceae bacterium]|nr:indole-3-glycerol-phosphate synthase [Saprospiraceae bacterium]